MNEDKNGDENVVELRTMTIHKARWLSLHLVIHICCCRRVLLVVGVRSQFHK